jgi:hypothetical protein
VIASIPEDIMPGLILLIAALLVPLGQAPAKPAYPKKSGIYAMTSQGPVELKVSGERNQVEGDFRLKCFFSPDSFDKIPAAEAVQSFYVSTMGWAAKDIYIVIGRDGLVNSKDNYRRLAGRAVQRGAVAFEVLSVDLETPGSVLRAITQLAPPTAVLAELEAYLVLDLRSTAGMNDRAYPIRIQIPK